MRVRRRRQASGGPRARLSPSPPSAAPRPRVGDAEGPKHAHAHAPPSLSPPRALSVHPPRARASYRSHDREFGRGVRRPLAAAGAAAATSPPPAHISRPRRAEISRRPARGGVGRAGREMGARILQVHRSHIGSGRSRRRATAARERAAVAHVPVAPRPQLLSSPRMWTRETGTCRRIHAWGEGRGWSGGPPRG